MIQGGASRQTEGDRMGVVPPLPTLLHMISPHPHFPGCSILTFQVVMKAHCQVGGGAEHVLCNSLSAYNI